VTGAAHHPAALATNERNALSPPEKSRWLEGIRTRQRAIFFSRKKQPMQQDRQQN
jgi:hypothetical protein